jgi:hypothetical protein
MARSTECLQRRRVERADVPFALDHIHCIAPVGENEIDLAAGLVAPSGH